MTCCSCCGNKVLVVVKFDDGDEMIFCEDCDPNLLDIVIEEIE